MEWEISVCAGGSLAKVPYIELVISARRRFFRLELKSFTLLYGHMNFDMIILLNRGILIAKVVTDS
jgi:hypothetical protein